MATQLNTATVQAIDSAVGHNISTCAELQAVDQTGTTGDIFNITRDIDCTGVDFVPLYQDSDDKFRGIFNGHGHSIRNLSIESEEALTALFSETATGAVIKNLRLDGGSVNGGMWSAALVGIMRGGEVSNVHSNLEVNGTDYTGGLIAHIYLAAGESATIKNTSTSGTVTGKQYTGGLVGFSENSQSTLLIQQSFSSADAIAATSTEYQHGGLFGGIFTENSNSDVVASSVIEDSYAVGDVSGSNQIGGFVGSASAISSAPGAAASTIIRRSYSAGTVSGTTISGSFVGDTYMAGEPEDATVRFENNFAAALLTPVGGHAWQYGFLGLITGEGEPDFTNNYYAAGLSEYNEECGPDIEDSGCIAVEDVTAFKGNHANPPFTLGGEAVWDFTNIWKTTPNNFPLLREYVLDETASLQSAVTGDPIVIAQTGCNAIENASAIKETSLAAQDASISYPAGFVNFSLTGCPVGGTATVTVTFVGDFDPNDVVVRKFNANTKEYATIEDAVASTTTRNGEPALQITYDITDGGELDEDNEANGIIIDPVGIGISPSEASLADTGEGDMLYRQLAVMLLFAGAAAIVLIGKHARAK